jgi:hypothetical protein
MAVIIHGTLIFGQGNAPSLPHGWKLKEDPNDWARAISPDGNEWFLTKTEAIPVLRVEGVERADMENKIPLTNL